MTAGAWGSEVNSMLEMDHGIDDSRRDRGSDSELTSPSPKLYNDQRPWDEKPITEQILNIAKPE